MMEEEETTCGNTSHWEGLGRAGKSPVVLQSELQLKLLGETSQTAQDHYFITVLAHSKA